MLGQATVALSSERVAGLLGRGFLGHKARSIVIKVVDVHDDSPPREIESYREKQDRPITWINGRWLRRKP